MNNFDGEVYGRGRVEEFLGDLKSLEALSQALVEGSAAAAKVVFLVSPSSTTKPSTLANAGNGAIIQGRPDDVQVVQVGKTADFRTAYEMAGGLENGLLMHSLCSMSVSLNALLLRRYALHNSNLNNNCWTLLACLLLSSLFLISTER